MTYDTLRQLLNVAKAQMNLRSSAVISPEDDEAGISRDTLFACQGVLSDLQALLELGYGFDRINRTLGGDEFHEKVAAAQGVAVADACFGPRQTVELPSFL
jgi:hypothetical protein